jgi:hypothetical protein
MAIALTNFRQRRERRTGDGAGTGGAGTRGGGMDEPEDFSTDMPPAGPDDDDIPF